MEMRVGQAIETIFDNLKLVYLTTITSLKARTIGMENKFKKE